MIDNLLFCLLLIIASLSIFYIVVFKKTKNIFELIKLNNKIIVLSVFVVLAVLIISPIFKDAYLLRLTSFVILIVSGFYLYQDNKKIEDNKSSTFPFLLTSALGAMLIGIAYLVGESLFRLAVLNDANKDIVQIFHKIAFFSDGLKNPAASELEAGQVGDFIGGLMNPLIAFSSLIVCKRPTAPYLI